MAVTTTLAGEHLLPSELRAYNERRALEGLSAFDFLTLGWLVATVASVVGFLRFLPWARPLALVSTMVSVVNGPFYPVVDSGPAVTLYMTASMVWGAMLAVAYSSPVSTWFSRSTESRTNVPV